MFKLWFTLAFLVIALLYALVGMRKGRKYVWSYSVTRLGVVIVSAVISAFASAGITMAIFKSLFASLAAQQGGTVAELFDKVPVMTEALCAIVAMIVAPILFYIVFALVRLVLTIVARIVFPIVSKKFFAKKAATAVEAPAVDEAEEAVEAAEAGETPEILEAVEAEDAPEVVEATETVEAPAVAEEIAEEPTKKEKKNKKKHKDDGYFHFDGKKNPWGRLCGAACGVVLFFTMMVPVAGFFGVVDDVTSWALTDTNDATVKVVAEAIDAGANNFGAKMVRGLGGKALYSAMTTYKVGDEHATLAKETKFISTMGHAIYDISDETISRKDAADSIREIDDAFEKTTLLPTVAPEFLNAAQESWDKGESFCGVSKPSFGSMDALITPLLSVLGNSSKQTVCADVTTFVETMAYMVEENALDDLAEDPISMFSNKDVTANVLKQFLANKHLSPVVGELAEMGVDLFGDTLNSPMTDVDFDSSNIQNPEVEATLLAASLAEMANLSGQLGDSGFEDLGLISSLGTLMDSFAQTETVGRDNTAKILNHMFGSEMVYTTIGFSREQSLALANTINEKAVTQGYTPLMRSLSQTVEVVQMTQKTDLSSEEMIEKMEVLIKDITPESAEVLQQMTSPEVMIQNGVAEQSAEPTSNMVSDVFGNLSDAKQAGMSDEEYNREAKAVTDLLNLSMNASNSNKSTTFGEGSATGKSVDEVVNNMLDSKVVTQTLVDTVYASGSNEPQIDPLNSQASLTETEQADLVTSLNNRWATDETQNEQEYYAVAALMNVNVQITDAGIIAA